MAWRNRLSLALPVLCLVALSCSRPVDPPRRTFNELRDLSEAGTTHQVVELASKTLKQYPRSSRLRIILGRAQFRLGHFRESVQALELALEDGWSTFEVIQLLGLSHWFLGEMEPARTFLEKAYELNPKDPEVLKKLGYLNYYLGQGVKAIDLFHERLEADPADLEAFTAHDALMALTGRWAAAQMVWTTEPSAGIQICTPGGWEMKRKEQLGPSGKIVMVSFSGRPMETEGRFLPAGVLLLTVVHNASKHPLPQFIRGAFRPGAQMSFRSVSREPAEMVRFLTKDSLHSLLEAWDLRVRDSGIETWTGARGRATYTFGELVGEDPAGNAIFGRSMGLYDPVADVFGSLVLYGPDRERESVMLLSEAIFNLALFGNLPGIPPVPKGYVTEEEYRARIQGFLQAGQTDRALTEAQQAVESYPAAGEFHALLAEGYLRLWRLEETVQALEEARRLGWSEFSAEYALGTARLGLGQAEEAERAFLRALDLRPQDSKAVMGAGLSFYREGKFDQAMEFFKRLAGPGDPLRESAQKLLEAVEAKTGNGVPPRMRWYPLAGEKSGLFCMPADWKFYEVKKEGDLFQVFCTAEPMEVASEDFDTGMIYVRYEAASSRIGRVLKEGVKPHEVVDGFLRQSFDRITDPQKVWQGLTPIFRWGSTHYGMAGFSYTDLSRRRVVRMLCCYEQGKDRLHVLTFRTAGPDLGPWEPFVEACFQTANFG
ncbi:MAG: tetratricopeptide repeat protein [Candidatus Omnitrophota bacterium]|nr:tetratricopeptide repeat protein [Candidatus Omnitrophota bacterium]